MVVVVVAEGWLFDVERRIDVRRGGSKKVDLEGQNEAQSGAIGAELRELSRVGSVDVWPS